MTDEQNLRLETRLDHLTDFINDCKREAYLLIDENDRLAAYSPGLMACLEYESDAPIHITSSAFLPEGISARGLYEEYKRFAGEESLPRVHLKTKSGALLRCHYRAYTFTCRENGRQFHLFFYLPNRQNNGQNLLQKFADTFMKDINLGVMLINTDFVLTDISDTACRVLGIDKQSALNKPMETVFASIPAEHQLVNRRVLDGMVVRNYAVSWMNNQERYELLLDTNVLKDERGQIVGAYLIFKDVTNLRSLEEQVKRSDRLSMIGQIAAGTAHEIRNPLTSIKGFMQVFKNTFIEKGMEKEQAYADIMLDEINRINELVSEFLLLSKRKDVTYKEIEIKTALREILPIIHNQAILYGINVLYEPAHQMPKVVADRELLKQVFLNICKNGIEAMTEGGTLTISERVDVEERRVLVEIRDTGPGIPNFLIDKIFDPFFTTKETGTGLGLSVCQRIIHDMGGSIRVSSKGFGTTFTVSLPYP